MAQTRHVLNSRLDVNFKAIFTQDTNESRSALKSFLSAAIGRTVTGVTVVKNEEAKEFDSQRGTRYDINCSFDDGTLAQIEMQRQNKEDMYGRCAEYYAARLASSALTEGEGWNRLPKVYQISVLDCIFDREREDFFHHYTMIDGRDGARLSETLNVIFLELPKLQPIDEKTDMENLPNINKWCKFLKEADNPAEKDVISALTASEEGIMNAETTLNKISMDRWRWIIQGRIEGEERDRITMLENAERRGKEATVREVARNLLKLGVAPETVAQGCSLPLEEVLALLEDRNAQPVAQ